MLANENNAEALSWYKKALEELGTTEIVGGEHNERIVEYHATTSLHADTDEVPWCSSFVNWCMEQVGIKGTGSAAARSWLKWGMRIEEPRTGCLVVLKRGDNPRSGHVGFFVESVNHGKHINIVGGNQSNMVKLATYPAEDVLAYVWPKGSEKRKTFGSKV